SSAGLMATRFRPTQTMPTAFTPLADRNGAVSHPDRPRMDRCIDYIWISDGIETLASEVCFNRPSPDDPSLWPSDHAVVWARLRVVKSCSPYSAWVWWCRIVVAASDPFFSRRGDFCRRQ